MRNTDAIRREYNRNLKSKSHVCTEGFMTREEYRLHDPNTVEKVCRTWITEDGKNVMSVSRQCTPLFESEWMDDVKILLDRIDELEGEVAEAVHAANSGIG